MHFNWFPVLHTSGLQKQQQYQTLQYSRKCSRKLNFHHSTISWTPIHNVATFLWSVILSAVNFISKRLKGIEVFFFSLVYTCRMGIFQWVGKANKTISCNIVALSTLCMHGKCRKQLILLAAVGISQMHNYTHTYIPLNAIELHNWHPSFIVVLMFYLWWICHTHTHTFEVHIARNGREFSKCLELLASEYGLLFDLFGWSAIPNIPEMCSISRILFCFSIFYSSNG